MSVLVPDLEVYNYVQAGIEKLAYTTTINDFFSQTISSHFKKCPDIEKEAERLILSWLTLNQRSYSKRYNESRESAEATNLVDVYQRTYTKKPLTSIQLLKYLQCISYNIEIKPKIEPLRIDLQLLKNCINDLLNSIVGNTDEYKNSTWCN